MPVVMMTPFGTVDLMTFRDGGVRSSGPARAALSGSESRSAIAMAARVRDAGLDLAQEHVEMAGRTYSRAAVDAIPNRAALEQEHAVDQRRLRQLIAHPSYYSEVFGAELRAEAEQLAAKWAKPAPAGRR